MQVLTTATAWCRLLAVHLRHDWHVRCCRLAVEHGVDAGARLIYHCAKATYRAKLMARTRAVPFATRVALSSLSLTAGIWIGFERCVPVVVNDILALPPSASPLSAECRELIRAVSPNNVWLKRAESAEVAAAREPDWHKADRELLQLESIPSAPPPLPAVAAPVAAPLAAKAPTAHASANANAEPRNSWDAVRERYAQEAAAAASTQRERV